MATDQEIQKRLTVHHRDSKTGVVTRQTAYQRVVTNGVVKYIDKKTGIEYHENWEPTGTTHQVAKQADTQKEAMMKEIARLEQEIAAMKAGTAANKEAEVVAKAPEKEIMKDDEQPSLEGVKIEMKPSTAFSRGSKKD